MFFLKEAGKYETKDSAIEFQVELLYYKIIYLNL